MKLSRLIFVVAVAFTLSLAVCAQAQTFSYFANFNGRDRGTSVIQATDGNLYTAGGSGAYGRGAIFRISPAGEFTAIYNFCSQQGCPDGSYPNTPILGNDGNLYGTTGFGGNRFQGGTVYKMTLDGEITTLYTFCITNQCPDGAEPAPVIQATDGNLYGITIGAALQDSGTLFRISPTGEFKVMHYFCSTATCVDGYGQTPPIQGIDGNLYGTTRQGGAHNAGVLYRLTLNGQYTVLYNFCSLSNCLDGSGPNQLMQDSQGNFFGTTEGGGSRHYGTVFEFTSANQYIVLNSFDYVRGTPYARLTQASNGNFYGTTQGAVENGGTVYEVTPKGQITFLNIFGTSCADNTGFSPGGSPLFQATNGTIYGATQYGNSIGECDSSGFGWGTIYQLSGLGALVETVPTIGKSGTSVLILGNNLNGSTSVTFNGVPANFTVESDTYIQATVPDGATTGKVSVITPSGTLNSNPQFVVMK